MLCWSSRVATHSRRFPGSPMRRSTSRWRRRAGQRPGETWVSIQRKLLHSRVDKAEECDRQKCPKMMDLCKDGGHCYGQCSFPSFFLIRCLQLLGTVEMTVVFATSRFHAKSQRIRNLKSRCALLECDHIRKYKISLAGRRPPGWVRVRGRQRL